MLHSYKLRNKSYTRTFGFDFSYRPLWYALFIGILLAVSQYFAWSRLDGALDRPITAAATVRVLDAAAATTFAGRMDVRVLASQDRLIPLDSIVRLYCFRLCDDLLLHEGQTFRTVVSFSPPQSPRNPTGFDYNAWLWRKNFYAIGVIRQTPSDIKPATGLEAWRNALMQKYQRMSEKLTHQRTIMALISGQKQWLTAQEQHNLIATGTMHLMVVSGLHMGLVSALCIFVALRLGANKITALLVGATAMGIYFWISGFGAPAQRAFVMALIAGIWMLFSRIISPWWGLVFALVLVSSRFVAFWQDAGVMFSFVAVIVIFACIANSRNVNWLRKIIWMQWSLCIVVGVVQAIFFSRLSVLAMPANIVVTPIISLVVLPIILIGACVSFISQELAILLWHMADVLLLFVWRVLDWLAAIPWSSIEIAGERLRQPLLLVSVIILACCVLLPRGLFGSRILPVVALLLIAWKHIPLWHPHPSNWDIDPVYRAQEERQLHAVEKNNHVPSIVVQDALTTYAHHVPSYVHVLASRNDLFVIMRYAHNVVVLVAAAGAKLSSSDLHQVISPTLRYIDVNRVIWVPLNKFASKGIGDIKLRFDQRLIQTKMCTFPHWLFVQGRYFDDSCSVDLLDVGWRVHPVARFINSKDIIRFTPSAYTALKRARTRLVQGTLMFAKDYRVLHHRDAKSTLAFGQCVVTGRDAHFGTQRCTILRRFLTLKPSH